MTARRPTQKNRFGPSGRDAALLRVRRTTKWVVATAIAGVGVVIGLAAHDVPGRASTATVATSTASAGSISSGSSASTGTGGSVGGLSAPTSPPTQSSQAPQASTGAS